MTTGRVRGLRAVRWQVDVEHSSARFSVRNFGFNIVHGTVPITHAYVDVDGRGAVVGSYAELDLSRLSTGNGRRDNDLRKPS
ncbi:MAG: YceI family protein, partial [Nocardioidaceae bacterium]